MWAWSLAVLAGCGLAASEPPASSQGGASPQPPDAIAPASQDPSEGPTVGCVERVSQLPGVREDEPRLMADRLLVVRKAARTVQLFEKGRAVGADGLGGWACYRVGLGFAPEGHKQREGDGRTPEGWYRTSDKPWSSFYKAIAVHYPNAEDAAAGLAEARVSAPVARQITQAVARQQKPPQTTALGGEILLHGGGSSSDWTLGCIALDNADLDALRAVLPASMAVDVRILP